MKKRHYYFMATFMSRCQTKVEISLPLDIDTWTSAIRWLSTRVPMKYALYSVRIEFLPPENLCDNQETQTKEQTLAE